MARKKKTSKPRKRKPSPPKASSQEKASPNPYSIDEEVRELSKDRLIGMVRVGGKEEAPETIEHPFSLYQIHKATAEVTTEQPGLNYDSIDFLRAISQKLARTQDNATYMIPEILIQRLLEDSAKYMKPAKKK